MAENTRGDDDGEKQEGTDQGSAARKSTRDASKRGDGARSGDRDHGKFERHTKGFGSKYLAKFNLREGWGRMRRESQIPSRWLGDLLEWVLVAKGDRLRTHEPRCKCPGLCEEKLRNAQRGGLAKRATVIERGSGWLTRYGNVPDAAVKRVVAEESLPRFCPEVLYNMEILVDAASRAEAEAKRE